MQQTTAGRQRGTKAARSRPTPPAASRRSETQPAVALRPGDVLFDRYRLERELGRGGVADVWRAEDRRLDRQVAIKVLHPHLLPDEGWRRRFVAEARSASGLAHPGIVPVYDVLDDPATPAIVFQLVDGESLATRLARVGELSVADAARVAAQVAGALDHAHRAGLVHRDVKPANIVIDREGRARLVDFGIARVVEDASAEREGREVVGTLRYMAPEQLAGKPTDARSDLYALGLVITEMLPNLDAAPAWLHELVDRLRAPNPADRPGSAGDVARALETGRLEARAAPTPPTGEEQPVEAAPIPEVDPDAVTRSFAATREEPARSTSAVSPAPVAAGDARSVAAVALSTDPPAAAVATPRPTRPATRSRTNSRSVVAAAVVTALLLGSVLVGRAALLGSGPPTVSASPAPTQPAPAQAPAPAPGGSGPKGNHGHGHGRG